MKFAFIALVIVSIAVLAYLVFLSFKLLKQAKVEAIEERKNGTAPKNLQRHPMLDEEWKKLDKLRKDLEKKGKK